MADSSKKSQGNPLADHYADLLAVLPRASQLSTSLSRGRIVDQALQDAGTTLDRPSMSVLMSLMMAGEPLRIGEIARRMQVAGPHVTRLVHELERRGLARRVPDPDDGRARLVELSPAGSDAVNGYAKSIVGWFGGALTEWSPEDLHTLGSLLTRLVDDLNAYTSGAAVDDADDAEGSGPS